MTEEEQVAADRLALGMFIAGHRWDHDKEPAEEPLSPQPRAPRPDPSQGASLPAPSLNPADIFDQAITVQPARGDGGWRPVR